MRDTCIELFQIHLMVMWKAQKQEPYESNRSYM